MKKILVGVLGLVLVLALTLTGCSSETDSQKLEKPVSDVTGGTEIQGTWEGRYTTEADEQNMIVLALNSNNTFECYRSSETDSTTDEATYEGTYTAENNKLVLNVEDITNENDNIEIDNPEEFDYHLDNDSLELTDKDKNIINLTRMSNEGASEGDETSD